MRVLPATTHCTVKMTTHRHRIWLLSKTGSATAVPTVSAKVGSWNESPGNIAAGLSSCWLENPPSHGRAMRTPEAAPSPVELADIQDVFSAASPRRVAGPSRADPKLRHTRTSFACIRVFARWRLTCDAHGTKTNHLPACAYTSAASRCLALHLSGPGWNTDDLIPA